VLVTAPWGISGTERYNLKVNRFAITQTPLELPAVAGLVSGPECGAVATFVGTVREVNLGRRVLRLEYEAYAPLAVRAFERIAAETAERWPGAALAIHHRVGTLEIGDASVVIAAASPHRAAAFAACRYAIERVKQIAPIWKREYFQGGEVWIEGATADPDDPKAQEAAFRRACA
jgi:molybdopterin synthase catalytic subunit